MSLAWRDPGRLDRQVAWLWAAASVGALLVALTLWGKLAAAAPPCPFRTLTGIPCPTCGTTRAVHALLQGHLRPALRLNPVMSLAAAAFVTGGPLAPLWLRLGGRVPVLPAPLPHAARAAVALALAANWIHVLVGGV